jgi:hypothetical protein
MRRIALLAIAAGFIFPILASAPAHAQATRTWVSGVGDDANPCSRTAPCKTFAGAISKTAASGEINCLDPGGFGALTITKAITISCQAGTAGVLVSGTNGIIVAAGNGDLVFLKGIDFQGLGSGLAGIRYQSGASLHVEDCTVNGFNFGIQIVPTSGFATFTILRTTLFHNIGGGIQIRPTSGFSGGVIEQSTLTRNAGPGITVDGTGGASTLAVTIHGSVINGNTIADGVFATGAVANVLVDKSVIVNNSNGLNATGGATIRVGNSSITGNASSIGGTGVLSYGNNEINGNGADTAPGAVPGGLH